MLKAELISTDGLVSMSTSTLSESTKEIIMDWMQDRIIEYRLKQTSDREWTNGKYSLTCNFDVNE